MGAPGEANSSIPHSQVNHCLWSALIQYNTAPFPLKTFLPWSLELLSQAEQARNSILHPLIDLKKIFVS